EAQLTLEENSALNKLQTTLQSKIKELESALYDSNQNEFWESQVAELEKRLREVSGDKHDETKKNHELERQAKNLAIQLANQEQMTKKYHEDNFSISQKLNAMSNELQVLRNDEAEARLVAKKAERDAQDWKEHSLKVEKELLEWKDRFD
ncbi:hypothetical protein BABINDRAFT_21964, partial [Babjeviella inositovora NRRL Y-12698]